MTFRLLTAPTETPVSLAMAKRHLDVEHSRDDALIQLYLDAAIAKFDGPGGLYQIALMPQSWAYDIDWGFPCNEIEIPARPLISIDAVKYADGDGATQTLAAEDYTVLLERRMVSRLYGGSWPAVRSQRSAVSIEFTAGYPDAASVPANIRSAILLWAGFLYADREPTLKDLSTIDNLMNDFRRW